MKKLITGVVLVTAVLASCTSAQAGWHVGIGVGWPGYYRPYAYPYYRPYVYPYGVYVAPAPVYVAPTPVYVQPVATAVQQTRAYLDVHPRQCGDPYRRSEDHADGSAGLVLLPTVDHRSEFHLRDSGKMAGKRSGGYAKPKRTNTRRRAHPG
jgi:hypothetical protein